MRRAIHCSLSSSSYPGGVLPCLPLLCSFHKFGSGYFPGTGDIGNMGHGALLDGARALLQLCAVCGKIAHLHVALLGTGGQHAIRPAVQLAHFCSHALCAGKGKGYALNVPLRDGITGKPLGSLAHLAPHAAVFCWEPRLQPASPLPAAVHPV